MAGNIRIGNHDLRHLSNQSLRQIVSVVPQRIDLFAGNVVENIAVGEFYPDMGRVIEVCNRLGMIKFIEQLPQGFNTYLGENGAALSGGQQQRIAIARAVYRNPHSTLRLLRDEKKTVIVIAHRLSTITMAQRIIVLDQGVVVQDGTFDELSVIEGQFRKMWTHQSIEIQEAIGT